MQVESMNFNSIKTSSVVRNGNVVKADDIKSILFLGIRSDLPATEPKRKVDIII